MLEVVVNILQYTPLFTYRLFVLRNYQQTRTSENRKGSSVSPENFREFTLNPVQ